ncbi:hypothetical protein KKA23_01380 [Patescibacteria group bacterium]|nr:hypothetical protein [Patescibacteria group bacterium]
MTNSKSKTVKVETFFREFEVDISDEACMEFGFKHNDKVLSPNGEKYTIVGMAVNPCGIKTKTLWFTMDGEGEQVHHWGYESLVNEGFKKIK